MANAYYTRYKEQIAQAGINLASGNVKAVLLTSGYSFSAAHQFESDLGANILTDGKSPNLASKTFTGGFFDAADVTFSSVTTAQTATKIAFILDTGTPATSSLLAFFDTGVTGLPFATNGGDITLTFDASGIFGISG